MKRSKRNKAPEVGAVIDYLRLEEKEWEQGIVNWVGSAQFTVIDSEDERTVYIMFNGDTEWRCVLLLVGNFPPGMGQKEE